MRHHLSITLGIAIVVMVGTAGAHEAAQGDVDDRNALQRFQQSTNEYMALRHEIERHLPPLGMSEEARNIQQAVEARAAAIRRARASAMVGDIFTADVREAFRGRILQALESRGYAGADLFGDVDEGSEGWEPPLVNGTFSWRTATSTPACVLAALPELPRELQYRFLGRDLLLVDIDANLIVDILPNAVHIPRPRLREILVRRADSLAGGSHRGNVTPVVASTEFRAADRRAARLRTKLRDCLWRRGRHRPGHRASLQRVRHQWTGARATQ